MLFWPGRNEFPGVEIFIPADEELKKTMTFFLWKSFSKQVPSNCSIQNLLFVAVKLQISRPASHSSSMIISITSVNFIIRQNI